MNCPEYLEISLQTVFDLFSHQDAQIMTHQDVLQLLNFVFKELGMSRSANGTDLDDFLVQFQLKNESHIQKHHFGERQFLHFSRIKSQNTQPNALSEIKIPIEPLIQQLQSSGCSFITRERVRDFLITIHNCLQIPKPVQDSDIERFISDFDRNGDGQIQMEDLKGIQYLKFLVRKCRRYQ